MYLISIFNYRQEVQDPEYPVHNRLQWMGGHVHQVRNVDIRFRYHIMTFKFKTLF